jgi:hypothetical protein
MALTDEELMEQALANQIPEAEDKILLGADKHDMDPKPIPEESDPIVEEPKSEAAKYLGQKLNHKPGDSPYSDKDADNKMIENKHLSRIGENIAQKAEIREGWIDVDKKLLGKRAIFYPEDWEFRIRPATVEAIRNWSNIDDENPNSVDDVFNEILKTCLAIIGPGGKPIPWGNINNWDRFFFLLLIREYTFRQGERKIKYSDYCPECDNEIDFELTSQSLMYDFPDEEVMKYYSREDRCWYIDPAEFDIEGEQPIQMYLPTLEKDAAIKAWLIARLQENRNRKIDQTFIRFASWLTPKISKDSTIAQRQIREIDLKYKSWDEDMFTFMDDVLRNIIVTPSTKLIIHCPICGEEVTSDIRFPNSIRDLFNVSGKYRKFGKK